jgi:hypothetical protein
MDQPQGGGASGKPVKQLSEWGAIRPPIKLLQKPPKWPSSRLKPELLFPALVKVEAFGEGGVAAS